MSFGGHSIEWVVNDAVKNGAELLCGGKRKGAQYWPTVLDHVDPECQMVTFETFGPTAPIIRVRDTDEAIRVANSTIYGLSAGIMTQDIDRAIHVVKKLEVGGVVINEAPGFWIKSIPFGGNKMSGVGRSGIRFAIEEMTNLKTIIV